MLHRLSSCVIRLKSSPKLHSIGHMRYNHNIRNVGVVAHIDAGKTTTSEQMLYLSGEINSIGRVDDGDTVMDFLPQERERGITISSAATTFRWKGCSVNLIDTPGHVDFTVEVERSARVLDGAILVVDAVAGVQAQTQTVWRQIKKQTIPAVAFINKMDREGASFYRSVASIRDRLGVNVVPIQVPLGCESDFRGVIDLIGMNKIIWGASTPGNYVDPTITKLEASDSDYEEANSARLAMVESIAEVDGQLEDKYLEDVDSISEVDIVHALRRACISSSLVPGLCGASLRSKGIHALLDSIVAFLPSPQDRPPCAARAKNGTKKMIAHDSPHLCALAFKVVYDNSRGRMVFVRTYSGTLSGKLSILNTTNGQKERINQLLLVSANEYQNVPSVGPGSVACLIGLKHTVTGDTLVEEKGMLRDCVLDGLQIPRAVFSIAIEPEKSSQQTQLEEALAILQLEDPSLLVEADAESGQTIIKGIGELHLDIVCDKLKRQFSLPVYKSKAYVAFRESLMQPLEGEVLEPVAHSYDRSIAGRRMFAAVVVQVSVLNQSKADECIVQIHPDVKKLMNAEEMEGLIGGLQGALKRGPNGYPVAGLQLVVTSLERDKDTTVGSIRACASTFVDHMLRADTHIMLEPMMRVELDVPTQFMGEVLSDLTVKRRARVLEVTAQDNIGRTIVDAQVPFATMLGYSTVIRSTTQGEGSFSMEYEEHSVVDKSMLSL